MTDGRFQFFQDVAVDLRRIACDFQLDRFAQRMANVALAAIKRIREGE